MPIKPSNNKLNKYIPLQGDGRKTSLYRAVVKKDLEKISFLLDQPGINVNKGDRTFSPLMIAVKYDSIEITKKLLEHPGTDINKMSRYYRASETWIGFPSRTSLGWAAYLGKINSIKLLLENPELDLDKESSDGYSPLFETVKYFIECYNFEELFDSYYNRGYGIEIWFDDEWDEEKNQPIFNCYELEYYYEDERDYSKIDNLPYMFIDEESEKIKKVLMTKEEENYLDIIKILLSDNRSQDKYFLKAFCKILYSIMNDITNLNEFLNIIENNNQNENTRINETSFQECFLKRKKYFLQKLDLILSLFNDLDENKMRCFDSLQVDTKKYLKKIEFRELFLVQRFDIFEKIFNQIQEYDINQGHSSLSIHYFEETQRILKNLDTPLMIACYEGKAERVDELLANPLIQINKRNIETGNSALGLACLGGHVDIIQKLLLREDIDINQKNAKNRTPLAIACFEGFEKIVSLFLEDPRILLHTWKDAIVCAIINEKNHIVRLFLEKMRETQKKKDPRNRLYRKIKHIALLEACKIDNLEIFNLLIKEKPEFKRRGLHGNTALHIAIMNLRENMVKEIIKYNGFKNNIPNNFGKTPFQIAVESSNLEIFNLIWKEMKHHIPHQAIYMIQQDYDKLLNTTFDSWKYSPELEMPSNAYTLSSCQGIVQMERKKTIINSIRYGKNSFERNKKNIYNILGDYLLFCSLAEINTYGKLSDGRYLPTLPDEVYLHIGSFLQKNGKWIKEVEPIPVPKKRVVAVRRILPSRPPTPPLPPFAIVDEEEEEEEEEEEQTENILVQEVDHEGTRYLVRTDTLYVLSFSDHEEIVGNARRNEDGTFSIFLFET